MLSKLKLCFLLKLQSFNTAFIPASPLLVAKTPGMLIKAVDSIAEPACPRLYIDVSGMFIAPELHHVTCKLALVLHIHMFSWHNIANALPPFITGTSIPSLSGINDVSNTSTIDDAVSDFTTFSLYQDGTLSGDFLKQPVSLCPFRPQKLHVLFEPVLPSLLPLFP